MKLLLENWRKYLAEESQPIKKLRIFDFDETIAYTDSEVRATGPEGELIAFPDQEAWDNFIEDMGSVEGAEAAGWSFDFSDYSKEEGNTSIESIHFFDDSDIHLNDVRQLREDFPEIEDIRIKKVFPGGISNVKQENKMDKFLKDHPYMEPDGLQD